MATTIRKSAGLAAALTAALTMAVSVGAQEVAAPPGGAGVVMPDALNAPPAPPVVEAAPGQAAPASECDQGMIKFQQRRNAQLASINALVKAKKGKGIDPVAACSKFRGLVGIESEMKKWAIKNKDWCSIPDQFIQSMTEGFAKTPQFANKACAAAAQAARARQGQVAGPGGGQAQPQPQMKLPSGPL